MQFAFSCSIVNSDPGTKIIKTTTTYTSKNPVSRELLFESPDTSSVNRSLRHQSPSYETRTIESSTKRNVSYNDDGLYGKPRRTISPTPVGNNNQHYVTETRTRTISPTPVKNTERYVTETRIVNNEIVPISKNVNYNEVVRVENSTGPNALSDMQLSDDILPKPKTKVTTTVRTYTYEIPEDGSSVYPDRDPPKNTAVFYKTERNERSANYYPNQSTPISPNSFAPLSIQETPQHNTTTVYKYDVTNTTSGQPQPQVIPPGGITIYPPQNTTIYKTETVNTTNKQYRSPTPNSYPDTGEIIQYPSHGHHKNGHPPHSYQNNGQPNNGTPFQPYQPNEPSVVVYKQTTTNTRNVIHPRQEREPLLYPFPVDGPIITEVDGSPPKRVEDLMASFGDVRFFISSIHVIGFT